MHAADHLDAALAAVEKGVEIPRHLAEIVEERRRLRVEGGEQQPLVIVELRHRHETPALALQFVVIGLLQIRHADQLAVIAVGPAVIGAAEAGRIAVIGSAQPVAAMPADIEEGAYHSIGAAHYQDGVFTHIGREEIAGFGDLALMAQKEPAAGEDALQFLAVDLRLDKDAAADQSVLAVDETTDIAGHVILPQSAAAACARLSAAISSAQRP